MRIQQTTHIVCDNPLSRVKCMTKCDGDRCLDDNTENALFGNRKIHTVESLPSKFKR